MAPSVRPGTLARPRSSHPVQMPDAIEPIPVAPDRTMSQPTHRQPLCLKRHEAERMTAQPPAPTGGVEAVPSLWSCAPRADRLAISGSPGPARRSRTHVPAPSPRAQERAPAGRVRAAGPARPRARRQGARADRCPAMPSGGRRRNPVPGRAARFPEAPHRRPAGADRHGRGGPQVAARRGDAPQRSALPPLRRQEPGAQDMHLGRVAPPGHPSGLRLA